VRPVMRPQPRQPSARQHPAHTARFPGWPRKPQARPVNVRNDGAVNSGENTASSVISDAGTGSTASGSIRRGDPFRRECQGTAGTPAIMEIVPQTPDQQTRNDVTARIAARIAGGWPRLGEPSSPGAAATATSPRSCPAADSPPRSCACAGRAPRTSGHRHLQGHHRAVQRKRVPLVLLPAHRHARAGNRRDPRPLRRPARREVKTPSRQP
jgi:hypothetical protein